MPGLPIGRLIMRELKARSQPYALISVGAPTASSSPVEMANFNALPSSLLVAIGRSRCTLLSAASPREREVKYIAPRLTHRKRLTILRTRVRRGSGGFDRVDIARQLTQICWIRPWLLRHHCLGRRCRATTTNAASIGLMTLLIGINERRQMAPGRSIITELAAYHQAKHG